MQVDEQGQHEEELQAVAEAAGRILDAYGHVETSDSSRVVYTDGDLNIGRESGTLEIIFRGTLVLRHGPGESVFEEHGDWARLVERIAVSVPGPPDQAA